MSPPRRRSARLATKQPTASPASLSSLPSVTEEASPEAKQHQSKQRREQPNSSIPKATSSSSSNEPPFDQTPCTPSTTHHTHSQITSTHRNSPSKMPSTNTPSKLPTAHTPSHPSPSRIQRSPHKSMENLRAAATPTATPTESDHLPTASAYSTPSHGLTPKAAPHPPSTPSTALPLEPSREEMHPSLVHKLADPPSVGKSLGFSDIDTTSRHVKHSENTPSKIPAVSPYAFQNIKTMAEHLGLSEQARKMMAEMHGDTEKIKAQMLAEQHEKGLMDGGEADSLAGRKIASARRKSNRFTEAHMAEFRKMDSIENHPSVLRARTYAPTQGGASAVEKVSPLHPGLKRKSSKANLDDAAAAAAAAATPARTIRPPSAATKVRSTPRPTSSSSSSLSSPIKPSAYAARNRPSLQPPNTPAPSSTTATATMKRARQNHHVDVSNGRLGPRTVHSFIPQPPPTSGTISSSEPDSSPERSATGNSAAARSARRFSTVPTPSRPSTLPRPGSSGGGKVSSGLEPPTIRVIQPGPSPNLAMIKRNLQPVSLDEIDESGEEFIPECPPTPRVRDISAARLERYRAQFRSPNAAATASQTNSSATASERARPASPPPLEFKDITGATPKPKSASSLHVPPPSSTSRLSKMKTTPVKPEPMTLSTKVMLGQNSPTPMKTGTPQSHTLDKSPLSFKRSTNAGKRASLTQKIVEYPDLSTFSGLADVDPNQMDVDLAPNSSRGTKKSMELPSGGRRRSARLSMDKEENKKSNEDEGAPAMPGTFTFRSDHTISFGPTPLTSFGSSPGQSSLRQVRPSLAPVDDDESASVPKKDGLPRPEPTVGAFPVTSPTKKRVRFQGAVDEEKENVDDVVGESEQEPDDEAERASKKRKNNNHEPTRTTTRVRTSDPLRRKEPTTKANPGQGPTSSSTPGQGPPARVMAAPVSTAARLANKVAKSTLARASPSKPAGRTPIQRGPPPANSTTSTPKRAPYSTPTTAMMGTPRTTSPKAKTASNLPRTLVSPSPMKLGTPRKKATGMSQSRLNELAQPKYRTPKKV